MVDNYKRTNADLIRSWDLPHGAFSYGVKTEALEKVVNLKDSTDTEVWYQYFTDTGLFNVVDLDIKNKSHKRPGLRMTLDYPEDWQFFEAIFEESFDEMTMAFTNIVLTKGREEYLPEICEEFINQYKGLKNIISATVVSATPLNEETLSKIKDKIHSEMTQGGTVEIETRIDASLLGGFVIEIGDSLYDASVVTRLNKLRKEFTGSVI